MIEISPLIHTGVFRVDLMLYLLTKMDRAINDAQYDARPAWPIGLALVTMVRLAGSMCTVLISSYPTCLLICS